MGEVRKGRLFIISGPSGAGKGTICAGLPEDEKAVLSVSMTTRAPRDYEEEGKSYYFVSKERFKEILAEDGFYEHAEIYGEYYGTPKAHIKEQLDSGLDVILEIDVKGAMQVKEKMPDTVLVFIMPPSAEELRNRIVHRGTETTERIARRLERTESEIAQVRNYDYCVVNDDLEKAIDDVREIMKSERGIPSDRAEELKIGNDSEMIIKRYHEGK